MTNPVHLTAPVEPGLLRVVLRPFGNLSVTVVWTILFAIVIWRRRRAFRDVMPAGLRGTIYEYSWPTTAPAAERPR